MRVSDVLILDLEAAPQLKPRVQRGLQGRFLELFGSWTRKGIAGVWFVTPGCPWTAGSAPWAKPGSCELRSAEADRHDNSECLLQAAPGTSFKPRLQEKEASVSQKEPIFDTLSWLETDTADIPLF